MQTIEVSIDTFESMLAAVENAKAIENEETRQVICETIFSTVQFLVLSEKALLDLGGTVTYRLVHSKLLHCTSPKEVYQVIFHWR